MDLTQQDPCDALSERSAPDFRLLFESLTGLYLVLKPDAPRYTIVAASEAYLRATLTKRSEILGRALFDVFPDNPDDPEASGVRHTTDSLARVVRTRAADAMAVQRHDPRGPGGEFEERFWKPLNSPVFDRHGELIYIVHCVEDVTGAVHREHTTRHALNHETERYRELFESAPDGIFVASPDGEYTDVNAAGCRLLGYSRQELVGRRIVEFLPPAAVARQAALQSYLLEGGSDVSEWQLRRRDGTYVAVELSVNRLPDGSSRTFARDITKRLRAEEALRQSEAKYAGIFSISADALISIDDAQRITMFNEGAEHIFGYRKSEILGLPIDALIPERFRLSHRRDVKGFAEGRDTARHMGTRRAQIAGLRKDGEEFPADAAISKLEVGGGTILTIALRDISEQTRLEDEQRLLADIGNILVSAGSDCSRLLNDVANLLVRETADWCAMDVVPGGLRRQLRLIHTAPAKAQVCQELEHYLLDHERSFPSDEVLRTQQPLLVSHVTPAYLESVSQEPDHLRVLRALETTSLIVMPLVARGHSLGALTIGSSSRHYTAQDALGADRLASRIALALDNAALHAAVLRAIQVRDEVLGIVAHDLRNPLNAIMLQSHALQCSDDEPDRRNQRVADKIGGAAKRMDRLIQDLLDVARLEGGQHLTVCQEATTTTDALAMVIEQLAETISGAGRKLNVDIAPDLPNVWADRTRLIQVLDNLLSNAIKFSRELIAVGAARRDGEVLLWVKDDGIGVTANDLPHLFDRFWQGSIGDRRGAGLGLSIVKGIVSAHAGRVWVESELGKGTTVYFTLPVAS